MEQGKASPETRSPSLDIKKGAEPFISGTFEYGLGRGAGGQKVYLFINKAQDQLKLHDAMVQFLGVYKTNKRVRSQQRADALGECTNTSPAADSLNVLMYDAQVAVQVARHPCA